MSKPGLHVLLVVWLVVVAGCLAAPTADVGVDDRSGYDTDRSLGVVDGYAYDDELDVNQSEGLSAAEKRAVVARTMARVEHLRGLQFTEPVHVDVISRDEYRSAHETNTSAAYATWQNQVWRALFQVDEHADVQDEFDALYGESVLGYYSPEEERVVLIVDDPDRPTIDRLTLAHELLHALQDQHFGLDRDDGTIDGTLAGLGIVEGDARYLEYRYEERCESGEWQCLERPPGQLGSVDAFGINFGLLITIYHPYSDGPAFVHHVHERGGWDAVDNVYADHPRSTSQVIHPERYPDDGSTQVVVEDRSTDEWFRFADLDERDDPTETVGEAALYATFWANGVIDRNHLFASDDPHSEFTYSHPITTGWRGDQLVPYRHADGDRFGYVFETEWSSTDDASTFREAYVDLLAVHAGEHRGGDGSRDLYRVPAGESYAGAYLVERSGTTVTVVHAPTIADLGAVHGMPGMEAAIEESVAGDAGAGSVRVDAAP